VLLAFARLEGRGTVPVAVFHADRPLDLSEFAQWPRLLRRSARTLAEVAILLGSDRGRGAAPVLGGDSNTHHTFRHFHGRLAAAGLERARPRRTWPVQWQGFPLVPVYALDGIWYGDHWRAIDSKTLEASLDSDHLPHAVTLRAVTPRTARSEGDLGR
jgi:hypothetical protein